MNNENKIKLLIFLLVFGTLTAMLLLDKPLEVYAPAVIDLSNPLLKGGLDE